MKISTGFKCFFRLTFLIVFILQCLNAQVTDTIHVEPGWNLLSLPVIVSDGSKSTIFPTSVSDAFIYQDSYLPKDTLENGYGFWLKYGSPDTTLITGNINYIDTIEVRTGWNIIGSLSVPIPKNMLTPVPPLSIISEYFNFTTEYGYQSSDTIYPGYGYWVKVNQDGSIILSSIGTTCPAIVDYASKTYNTIQIGNQCWLKENLDVGTMIHVLDTARDNGVIEKYCYDNDTAMCDTYGGLYSWDEAMQYTTTEGVQGICPTGWHIPTYTEFQTLSTTVGGDGNAFKAIGQGMGDGAGTNTSGFSALLSGARYRDGYFYLLGNYAGFWISTEYESNAYFMDLVYDSGVIDLKDHFKDNGFSIRCLKD